MWSRISDGVMEKQSNCLDPINLSPECVHMRESRLSDQDTVDGEKESREKSGERKRGKRDKECKIYIQIPFFHSCFTVHAFPSPLLSQRCTHLFACQCLVFVETRSSYVE